jgi:hypothetical protein
MDALVQATPAKVRVPPSAGRGRPPGSQNKATQVAKQAIADFLENNAPKVQKLFDQVAKKNPARALELYDKFAEYVLPKLTRTTLVGDPDAPLQVPMISISFPQGGPGQAKRAQQPALEHAAEDAQLLSAPVASTSLDPEA